MLLTCSKETYDVVNTKDQGKVNDDELVLSRKNLLFCGNGTTYSSSTAEI